MLSPVSHKSLLMLLMASFCSVTSCIKSLQRKTLILTVMSFSDEFLACAVLEGKRIFDVPESLIVNVDRLQKKTVQLWAGWKQKETTVLCGLLSTWVLLTLVCGFLLAMPHSTETETTPVPSNLETNELQYTWQWLSKIPENILGKTNK